MFPVTDFNFVVCGIATVAATVGYAFTRNIATPSNSFTHLNDGPPSDQEAIADFRAKFPSDVLPLDEENVEDKVPFGVQEPTFSPPTSPLESSSSPDPRPSLKRKQMHDHDENNIDLEYPHVNDLSPEFPSKATYRRDICQNLEVIYPNKRSRTPPTEGIDQCTLIDDSDSKPVDDEPILNVQPVDEVHAESVGPIAEPEVPPEPEISTVEIEANKSESEVPATIFLPVSPFSPFPQPKSTPIRFTNVSGGFATFAGSSSSAFSSSSRPSSARPIWSTASDADGRQGMADPSSPNDGVPPATRVFEDPSTNEQGSKEAGMISPNALTKFVPKLTSTYTHSTGEEDEDVECELKGVKLYIKRGVHDFSDGMLGHVKLLANKTTLDERLLFRRDPLWKVSMNVRLRPALRCTFDSGECILRIILKEMPQKNGSGEDNLGETIIYALKPGRSCSKKDFRDFAHSVLASSNLKPV